jgi:hypothetical protein
MYADNKTLSKRVEVHREILAVTRRYTATPYRWLRVLADMLAREPGFIRPDASYGRNILLLAEEHDIPLDGVVLAEVSEAMSTDPVRLLAAVLPSKLRRRAQRLAAHALARMGPVRRLLRGRAGQG